MVICDFINGSITLFFLIFFKKNFYYILIFQLSQMFFSKFFLASSSSLLVEIVPKDELLKTTSKLNFYNTSISTLAPAIALFIYSRVGIRPILVINVLSYFISGFFECFITYEHKKVEKIESIIRGAFKKNNNYTQLQYFIKSSRTSRKLKRSGHTHLKDIFIVLCFCVILLFLLCTYHDFFFFLH